MVFLISNHPLKGSEVAKCELQFLSVKSCLKTGSLGLINPLGTAYISALSQYVLVSCFVLENCHVTSVHSLI